MSEVVRYKGKLKLVEKLNNETLEQQCKRILEENDKDIALDFYDSYEEMFYDEFYKEYVIVENNIYHVESIKNVYDNDIFLVHENNDGTFDYDVCYYNGACNFDEAIGSAFEEMEGEGVDLEKLELKDDDILMVKFDMNKIKPLELSNYVKGINSIIKNKTIAIPRDSIELFTSNKKETKGSDL